jgi:hypothetical protein
LTDNYSEEDFTAIEAALKELPYFSPSADFADKVMARVRLPGAAQVPAVAERRAVVEPRWSAPIERRAPAQVPQADYRRSIPARLAAASLVAAVGVTMTAVVLVAVFDVNLFVLISRIFGQGTVAFLSSMVTGTTSSAATAASGVAASAGTATGIAAIGSFAAGAAVATAALRAAASASRRAA